MLKKYKNSHLIKVIIAILLIWTSGAMIISIIEPGAFKKLSNSLWWAIVTMTTVGYGDMAPTTVPGRILAVFIMLTGIVLVAIVTATISSSFITKKIMEGKGLEKINLKNHIIVCGWNLNIINLIKRLLSSLNNNQSEIVLINDQHQNDIDNIMTYFQNDTIKYVRGDYTEDTILDKANASHANYAIILNDTINNNDEKVILTTLTLKKLSNKIKVISQINDKNKEPFLKRANADVILNGDDYNSFMAISHISEPNSAEAIKNIIDSSTNNSIKSQDIPNQYIGKSFKELHSYFLNEIGTICLGLFTNQEKMGISDILSSDNSALDKFIEKKLKQAGHSLEEQNKVNILLNPDKNYTIQKGQGAILLK
tara:strand:- start:176 stop:1279 length:1104 start_codon:yes stop_codon:yes gene_type:complete